jgi:hypothetical protein
MHDATTFRDAEGRSWNLRMTLADARRVDRSDFSALTDQPIQFLRPDRRLLEELEANTPLTFAIIWAIVQPQCAANDVADEETFVAALDGRAMEAARMAFYEALADFFQPASTVIRRVARTRQAATRAMQRQIDIEAPKMEKAAERAIRREIRNSTQAIENTATRFGKRKTPSGE